MSTGWTETSCIYDACGQLGLHVGLKTNGAEAILESVACLKYHSQSLDSVREAISRPQGLVVGDDQGAIAQRAEGEGEMWEDL